eukprot:scaffold7328_cov314-Pinguiococcus_pyrenoidosus.AAC.42
MDPLLEKPLELLLRGRQPAIDSARPRALEIRQGSSPSSPVGRLLPPAQRRHCPAPQWRA